MSRIDDLIAYHCPGGVEHRTLREVGTVVSGLSGKTKADFVDGNARYVSYKNVFANIAVDQRRPDMVRVTATERQNKLQLGDVLFTGSSESVEDVGLSAVIVTEPDEPLYLNSFCFALRLNDASILLPGFAKYLFRSDLVRAQIRRTASGVTRINISKQRFMEVRIPVPPLEVQREIVRILDKFTQLEAELEAELEARRTQYAHYRDALLTFESNTPPHQGPVVWTTLGDLGKWVGGMTPSKAIPEFWMGGDVPWLASMDITDESTNEIRGRVTRHALEKTALKVVPAPSVAVVMRSNILRRTLPVGYLDVDTTVNQDIRALVPREGVSARYVYQVLRSASENIRVACVRTDGSMAAVDSKTFFGWPVALPPLDQQLSIAARLDSFDDLVGDLESGLPAEIAARRAQYEHYRDRLLTFEEAA